MREFKAFYALSVLIAICNSHCVAGAAPNEYEVVPSSNKLELDVFYSPMHNGSITLIQWVILDIMSSELGLYVHLKLYPVANCQFAKQGSSNPLSCNFGEEESTLSLEQLCAYRTLSQGSKTKHRTEQQIIDKIRTVEAIDYVRCTLKNGRKLTAEERIYRCRSHLSRKRADNIRDCISKNAQSYSAEAMKLFEKYNPSYFPFFVVNGTQSEEQDREGSSNLWKMLCKKLRQIPKVCNNPADLFVVDYTTIVIWPGPLPPPTPPPVPELANTSVPPCLSLIALPGLILFLKQTL